MIGVRLESKLKSLQSHKASPLQVNEGQCAALWAVREGWNILSCNPLLYLTSDYEKKLVQFGDNLQTTGGGICFSIPEKNTRQTSSLQLVLFIIATNWKTIHHINIIVVSQKMEKQNKTTFIYFLPRYWTTLIFTCSDEIGLKIILWQWWLHDKEKKTEHLPERKPQKQTKRNKKTTRVDSASPLTDQ